MKTVIKYTLVIKDFIQDRKDRIIQIIELKANKDDAFLDSLISQYKQEITMAEKDIDYVMKNTKHAYDYFMHYKLKLEGKSYADLKRQRYSI